MKNIFFLLILIGTFKTNAQTVFLPNIGTTWHYLFRQYNVYSTYNTKIEYVKDSTYMGENIKILKADMVYYVCNYNTSPNVFIKQRNDSVWFLHSQQTNNTWQLLIDYNASPGQHWSFSVMNTYTPTPINSTCTVTVNSVSTTTINSIALKSLNVTYYVSCPLFGNQTYTSTINERLGDIKFLFNIPNQLPFQDACTFADSLLCYQDATFGLKQFTSMACEYPTILGINKNTVNNINIKLFPNPTSDILYLELENYDINSSTTLTQIKDFKLEILDSFGQVILQKFISNKLTHININEFPKGIYFIKIFDAKNLIETKKLSKN